MDDPKGLMGRKQALLARHRSVLVPLVLILFGWILAAPTAIQPPVHEPGCISTLAAQPLPETVTARHLPAPSPGPAAVVPPAETTATPDLALPTWPQPLGAQLDPGHAGDPADARAPPPKR